jgi:hypothetical protein
MKITGKIKAGVRKAVWDAFYERINRQEFDAGMWDELNEFAFLAERHITRFFAASENPPLSLKGKAPHPRCGKCGKRIEEKEGCYNTPSGLFCAGCYENGISNCK